MLLAFILLLFCCEPESQKNIRIFIPFLVGIINQIHVAFLCLSHRWMWNTFMLDTARVRAVNDMPSVLRR